MLKMGFSSKNEGKSGKKEDSKRCRPRPIVEELGASVEKKTGGAEGWHEESGAAQHEDLKAWAKPSGPDTRVSHI